MSCSKAKLLNQNLVFRKENINNLISLTRKEKIN